jgi:hypothetical protein
MSKKVDKNPRKFPEISGVDKNPENFPVTRISKTAEKKSESGI